MADIVLASMGQTGALVEAVQQKLLDTGVLRVPVDGDFGPTTKDGVKAFQATRSLPVTGSVDPDTWTALQSVVPAPRAEARKHATWRDLVGRSRIISGGVAIKRIAFGSGSVLLAQGSGALDMVSQWAKGAQDAAEKMKGVGEQVGAALGSLGDLVGFVGHHAILVAAVALVTVAIIGSDVVCARVEDHKTGKTL